MVRTLTLDKVDKNATKYLFLLQRFNNKINVSEIQLIGLVSIVDLVYALTYSLRLFGDCIFPWIRRKLMRPVVIGCRPYHMRK